MPSRLRQEVQNSPLLFLRKFSCITAPLSGIMKHSSTFAAATVALRDISTWGILHELHYMYCTYKDLTRAKQAKQFAIETILNLAEQLSVSSHLRP